MKISPKTGECLPETYEEWVSIHGEPDYLFVSTKPKNNTICIIEPKKKEPIDTSNVFHTDQQGRIRMNYSEFSKTFIAANECVYCHGQFYTPDGAKSVGSLRQDIAESLLAQGWTDKLDVPTKSLITSIQDLCYRDDFDVNENMIPFANGDLYINKGKAWEFHRDEKAYTAYRLSVNFVTEKRPTPLFNKWLHDLFVDEDIVTIQEIMGYMLVPVTAAQEAFFLVGGGQAGKSVFGVIINGILGNAVASMTTKDLVEKRFQIATAENKLVVYDDDLGEAALESTGLLKKLITADSKIPAERKFKDTYEFLPYCKVIASTNIMLSSLYDDTDGFYRRLHPIKVKDRDPKRKIIEKFGQMIVREEAEGIVQWALEGLRRLMANGWKISWSERSREYMAANKADSVNYPTFLHDTLDFGEGDISSKELQRLYERWCKENNATEAKSRRMQTWLRENAELYHLRTNHNLYRNGKHVRGYSGACIKTEWRDGIMF